MKIKIILRNFIRALIRSIGISFLFLGLINFFALFTFNGSYVNFTKLLLNLFNTLFLFITGYGFVRLKKWSFWGILSLLILSAVIYFYNLQFNDLFLGVSNLNKIVMYTVTLLIFYFFKKTITDKENDQTNNLLISNNSIISGSRIEVYFTIFILIYFVVFYIYKGSRYEIASLYQLNSYTPVFTVTPTLTPISTLTTISAPQPTTPASCYPTNIIDKSVYKDSKITNWIDYENSEFGFAFSYPKEFGKVKVTSTIGEGCYTESQARVIKFMFYQKEEDCTKGQGWTCGNVIEIEAAAPDFSGYGNDRQDAYSAGYIKKSDGSVSYKLLTQKLLEDIPEYRNPIFFKGINTEGIIDSFLDGMYNKNIVKIIFNLKHQEITGIGFMTMDDIGETKNADVLKLIAKTFRLLN